MDVLNNNPHKLWNWWEISQNRNLTMDIINMYPDKSWSWAQISKILI